MDSLTVYFCGNLIAEKAVFEERQRNQERLERSEQTNQRVEERYCGSRRTLRRYAKEARRSNLQYRTDFGPVVVEQRRAGQSRGTVLQVNKEGRMLKALRRFLIIAIIIVECLCVSQVLSAEGWSYDIETSQGTKTIVLPEGMTFEQAYIAMSKLYIEERIDHEALIAQTENLVLQAKEFEAASVKLKELQSELVAKEEEIASLYKKLNRIHPVYFLFTGGVSTNEFKAVDSIDIGFGAELFEYLVVIAEVSYPWSLSLKAGVRF